MQTIRIIVAATTFLFSAARVAAAGDEIVFPRHPNVVDVSRPLYNAKGDGVTDNTVPGLYSYGTLCVLDAKLTGRGDATENPPSLTSTAGAFFCATSARVDTKRGTEHLRVLFASHNQSISLFASLAATTGKGDA